MRSAFNSTRAFRNVGFTLIELLVAIGLIAVLGLGLISTVRRVVGVAAEANARGDVALRAQFLLNTVAADLEMMVSGPGGRFVAGRDPLGRNYFAFVRGAPEERTSLAGIRSGSDRPDRSSDRYDRTWTGAASGRYRAFSGLTEVCYLFAPEFGGTALWRGLAAPPGGGRLAAARDDVWDAGGPIADLEYWFIEARRAAPSLQAKIMRDLDFSKNYRLVDDEVLYLGVELWHPATEGWELPGARGPRYAWESAARTELGDDLDDADWPGPAVVADEPVRDMGFPRALRLSVTCAPPAPLEAPTTLAARLTADDTTVSVRDGRGLPNSMRGRNFARVNDEWIEYRSRSGNALNSCVRGARGTKAVEHAPGSEVRAGQTFTRILTLPGGR